MMMQILQVCISHLRNLWHYSALSFFFLNGRGMLHNRSERGGKNKALARKPSQSSSAHHRRHPETHTPQFLKQLVLRNKSLPKHKASRSVRGKGIKQDTSSLGLIQFLSLSSPRSESSVCIAELLALPPPVTASPCSASPTCKPPRALPAPT